jgi:transposase
MLKVRTTKTASGKTAVQVVYRHHQKTEIAKHIGTAINENEQKQLLQLANAFIATNNKIPPLLPEIFTEERQQKHVVSVEDLDFTHTYHTFAHEFLSQFYDFNGFNVLNNNLLRDLAIMRIVQPSSKLRAAVLFNKYFSTTYTQNMLYKGLPKIRSLKEEAEKIAVSYAKKHLGFDFSLVFYDVTTLYFETFKEDTEDFKKPGFSKDNKPQQPQVMIGLVVNQDGYPIAVATFPGNTFEGHTMLPVIRKLQKEHGIQTLTIVADAGMLSIENIEAIEMAGLTYIVGARLGNIATEKLVKISKGLNKTEGIYYRIAQPHGLLICDYSQKRANKDRSDRKKQLAKAQYQVDNPEKTKRRVRFVREATKATVELNQELIEKDELREGIKGYYTNLEYTESELIVQRYKDLWHVEKSFRIAKSDLEARPIFHHKKESIETHMLIVFVSLCVAKSIELKTGYSIQKVKDMIWDILDIVFEDTLTNKTYRRRMKTVGNPIIEIMKNLHVDNTVIDEKQVLKG